MINISIKNITRSHVSAIGLNLDSGQAGSLKVDSSNIDAIKATLDQLQSSGYITYSVHADFNSALFGWTTTQDMDLYVDVVHGSDVNSGTKGAPFKSIQMAIAAIPKLIKHSVTIHLGAGTFYIAPTSSAQATLELDGFVVDGSISTSAGINIIGTMAEIVGTTIVDSWLDPTLSSPGVIGVSGTPWPLHAFKGMFVAGLSGDMNGLIFPIIDNTTNTILVMSDGYFIGTGDTFHIINPSSIISDAAASDPTTPVVSNSIVVQNCQTAQTFSAAILIKNVGIITNGGIGIGIFNTKGFVAEVCSITNGSAGPSGIGILTQDSGLVQIFYCYIGAGANLLQDGVQCQGGNFLMEAVDIVAQKGMSITSFLSEVSSFSTYLKSVDSTYNVISGNLLSAGDLYDGGTGVVTGNPGVRVQFSNVGQYGNATALATLNSGTSVVVDALTTTTASHFVSLTNGATWVTKADIEAGTNKTIFNTSTGALAKEI